MKHYDYVELNLYRLNLLNEDLKLDIENHLKECPTCRASLISTIGYDDIEEAGGQISDDFTEKVMDKLDNKEGKLIRLGEYKTKNHRRNFFIRYAALACITVILSGMGFFESNIIDEYGDRLISSETSMDNKIYNLPDEFFQRFSDLLNKSARIYID